MFCIFVNKFKKFVWLRKPVPAMLLRAASDDAIASSNDECPYFDHDIPNAAHIEHEYGVSHIQRIKVFQRMTVYGAVAKDVHRNMWKGIRKALEAIDAQWNRLRAQKVWD